MSYSMVLDNGVILSGLNQDIILSCKPTYIKEIYKMKDNNKISIYNADSPGSMICNENFNDDDIKIVYKFDINSINKIPFL